MCSSRRDELLKELKNQDPVRVGREEHASIDHSDLCHLDGRASLRRTTAAGHSLLDYVLPVRVLSDTTPEERQHIAARIGRLQPPGYFSWIGAAAVLLLSGYALFTANRLDRVRTHEERPLTR